MKRKIEISIFQIILYFFVLFVVSGLLLYKSCERTPVVTELSDENQEKEMKERPASVKKRPEVSVPEQNSEDTANLSVEKNPEEENALKSENSTEISEIKSLGPLKIVSTRSLFNSSTIKESDLPEKKIYYEGDHGKLESFIHKKENTISELLISTNYKGEKIDELEIGFMESTGNPKKYALFSRNKISVYEITRLKNGKQSEEAVTEYLITPELKFVKGKTYSKIM